MERDRKMARLFEYWSGTIQSLKQYATGYIIRFEKYNEGTLEQFCFNQNFKNVYFLYILITIASKAGVSWESFVAMQFPTMTMT